MWKSFNFTSRSYRDFNKLSISDDSCSKNIVPWFLYSWDEKSLGRFSIFQALCPLSTSGHSLSFRNDLLQSLSQWLEKSGHQNLFLLRPSFAHTHVTHSQTCLLHIYGSCLFSPVPLMSSMVWDTLILPDWLDMVMSRRDVDCIRSPSSRHESLQPLVPWYESLAVEPESVPSEDFSVWPPV